MRGLAITAAGLLLSVSGLVCSVPARAASEHGIKLGVLEDLPGHYAGQSHFRAVRVVFQQEGRRWRPYPSECSDQQCLKTISARYPKSVKWTVGLSGRAIGQATGHTPSDFEWYGGVGLQRLGSTGPVPTVGKRSNEYAGYIGEPAFRPLIVSSGSYFTDPDSWKALPLSKNVIRVLRQHFHQRFRSVSNCTAAKRRPRPWRYTDADISVWKSYVAKTGWALAALRLINYRCDDNTDDGAWASQWFAISPRGQVRFLEADLNFLDAGDYDQNGRSALVFSINGDNRGGYEMFYDDFRRRAVFQFSYH